MITYILKHCIMFLDYTYLDVFWLHIFWCIIYWFHLCLESIHNKINDCRPKGTYVYLVVVSSLSSENSCWLHYSKLKCQNYILRTILTNDLVKHHMQCVNISSELIETKLSKALLLKMCVSRLVEYSFQSYVHRSILFFLFYLFA